VIDRLRPELAKLEGINVFLQAAQDIRGGGRISRGQYEYTLQDSDVGELSSWSSKLLEKMKALPQLADVATDQQLDAPQLSITINRDQAARFGIEPQVIDDTLNDAFGQRRAVQYFTQVNNYDVILEVLPDEQGDPATLDKIYIKSPITGAAGRFRYSSRSMQATSARLDIASGPVPDRHPFFQSFGRSRN
jgi:HAE1 family hydrophobic/amphiphilic exporter-1